MIGETITAPPAGRWPAAACAGAGAALFVASAVSGNRHWLFLGLLPLALGLALTFLRRRAFVAHFTADSLEVEAPSPRSVPYDNLQGLWAPQRPLDPDRPGPASYPIGVIDADGVVEIPAGLDVPSDQVFRFLSSRIPPTGSRDIHPALADFRCHQELRYGKHVSAYRARSHLGTRLGAGRRSLVALVFGLTGVLWMALSGFREPFIPWGVFGVILAIFGFAFALIFLLADDAPCGVRHWRKAGLVVSPGGLALVQGDLKGELRWDELREVELKTDTAWFGNERGPRMVLVVPGARIVVPDIYDRPLGMIHAQIDRYRRGQGLPPT